MLKLDQLLRPVPSFVEARQSKLKYREYPIDSYSQSFNEPLVFIADYGLAGQAYWSRPNRAMGEPIKGVRSDIRVRKTIANLLKQANDALNNKEITDLFGYEVELYVEDGLRTIKHQSYLYNIAFPKHIAEQNPNWSEEQVLARRDELVAKPPKEGESPSPHMTGAAVDLGIRKKQESRIFIPDTGIEFIRKSGATDDSCNPDYGEYAIRKSEYSAEEWDEGVRNRRILNNLLNSFGMQVNPTEFWHWSYGDQMWASIKNKKAAIFGAVVDE